MVVPLYSQLDPQFADMTSVSDQELQMEVGISMRYVDLEDMRVSSGTGT